MEEKLMYIEKQRGDFKIGQKYTKKTAKTLICKKCRTDKFIVGQDEYFTVIKCSICGWEVCIHDG